MGKASRPLIINSRPSTTSCSSCAAAMLPNHTVCRTCGGMAADYNRRIDYDAPVDYDLPAVPTDLQSVFENAAPAYARPNPERLSTILGCWPFGAANASDGPTISLPNAPTVPTPHLEPATYPSDVPTQRVELVPPPSVILT